MPDNDDTDELWLIAFNVSQREGIAHEHDEHCFCKSCVYVQPSTTGFCDKCRNLVDMHGMMEGPNPVCPPRGKEPVA